MENPTVMDSPKQTPSRPWQKTGRYILINYFYLSYASLIEFLF